MTTDLKTSLTVVEAAIFSEFDGQPYVVLTPVTTENDQEIWILPSNAVQDGSAVGEAARLQVSKEVALPQFPECGLPLLQLENRVLERDLGEAMITSTHVANVPSGATGLPLILDGSRARWFRLEDLPELAFDHRNVIAKAFRAGQSEWHCYRYARPMVAADCAVFSIKDDALHITLVKRKHETEEDKWALPGGFLREHESPEAAARRELFEETGIADKSLATLPMEQVGIYGAPGRDPRGWVISTAYLTLIPMDRVDLVAGSDAKEARWFPMDNLPELAFDHAQILEDARQHLVSTELSEAAQAVFGFLPEVFTQDQAQKMFELLSSRTLDKSNFRKWLKNKWELEDTGLKVPGGRHRHAGKFKLVGLKR